MLHEVLHPFAALPRHRPGTPPVVPDLVTLLQRGSDRVPTSKLLDPALKQIDDDPRIDAERGAKVVKARGGGYACVCARGDSA